MAKQINLSPHSHLPLTALFQLKDETTGSPSSTYVWGTWEPIDFPEDTTDQFYTTGEHDVGRLDLVAYRFYGNVHLWWVIAHVNDILDQFSDSADDLGLVPGTVLRIPSSARVFSILARGTSASTSTLS